jgi:hypothetical protein
MTALYFNCLSCKWKNNQITARDVTSPHKIHVLYCVNIISFTQCGAFYLALSQNCEKRLVSFIVPASPDGTAWVPLNGFS